MAFFYHQKIKFRQCDPAGIVFYPRYFEMINDTVEAFFDQVLHYPFADVMQGNGVPTVQIDARFTAPSYLGEVLDIALNVARVGRSSLDLRFDALCDTQPRFNARATLVFIAGQGTATPWPDKIRTVLDAEGATT